MTADAPRDLSRADGPPDELVMRGLPAFVERPGGLAPAEEARAAEPHAWVSLVEDVAGRGDAGRSPFPMDAIEID